MNYNVALLCSILSVSRSGYYARTKAVESRKAKRDKELKTVITTAFTQNRAVYGTRCLKKILDLLSNNPNLSKNVPQQQASKKTMLNLNRIDKKERLMKATIDLTLKKFDELLSDFDRAYEKAKAGKRTAQVVFHADLSETLSDV